MARAELEDSFTYIWGIEGAILPPWLLLCGSHMGHNPPWTREVAVEATTSLLSMIWVTLREDR
jgi:hypothetical protein